MKFDLDEQQSTMLLKNIEDMVKDYSNKEYESAQGILIKQYQHSLIQATIRQLIADREGLMAHLSQFKEEEGTKENEE